MINIISQENIDFIGEIKHDLATSVIVNLKKKEREIDTLWFMANVLYRRNGFSQHFVEKLVKNNIGSYIKKRVGLAFGSEAETTIFYYFVGGLAATLDFIEKFSEYKVVLESISYLSEL